MFDFELKMRKTISEILAPSVDRMAKSQEAYARLFKGHEMAMEKITDLEEAVYNQGRSNAIFDDIRDKISKNEAQRKMDNEKLRNYLTNTEKLVNDHDFTVEQSTKKLDTAVIACVDV
jgi:hypothetical protein